VTYLLTLPRRSWAFWCELVSRRCMIPFSSGTAAILRRFIVFLSLSTQMPE
jgi:hypothetical protein